MAKKAEKAAKTPKAKAAPSVKASREQATTNERPPESAENFEHVLRRLISGRSSGQTAR